MACACAITGGELLLSGARAEHLRSLLFKLSEAGIHIKDTPGGLMVFGRAKQPFEIRTMVYPGFPTDLQAPMMAVACKTPGTSVFLETIFENRFMHAAELSRLGAHIRVENRVAVVEGTPYLTGAPVRATDLRAGAALILAGLCAEGETLVDDSGGHIERGYCKIEKKAESRRRAHCARRCAERGLKVLKAAGVFGGLVFAARMVYNKVMFYRYSARLAERSAP